MNITTDESKTSPEQAGLALSSDSSAGGGLAEQLADADRAAAESKLAAEQLAEAERAAAEEKLAAEQHAEAERGAAELKLAANRQAEAERAAAEAEPKAGRTVAERKTRANAARLLQQLVAGVMLRQEPIEGIWYPAGIVLELPATLAEQSAKDGAFDPHPEALKAALGRGARRAVHVSPQQPAADA